ncbi:MAG: thioredoxin domain-containing protein, partial [Verrucomicrobia bacterium]|nr:thioredoxin domain-containing protein [Verrucomicrobiota bacterium]
MPNRLAQEKSPYLLQHAGNPVDWYPWGPEAFAKAEAENKIIFLSVGYSTCHWCHVMERESFEKEAVAELLNQNFVSIKVDREERPDVDRVYMLFVQSTTGSGGWPMSVFLTPDRKPFLGGTYYPPEDRYGRPGFSTLLRRLAEIWQASPEKILDQGQRFTDALRGHLESDSTSQPANQISDVWFEAGFRNLLNAFDPEEGGFTSAPKFPRASVFDFLFRYWQQSGEDRALDMALFTLEKMADGGMYDHLGGGFHRYSVDARWHVPHFEKMLYDQAQLAWNYLVAFQISGRTRFREIADGILDYVLRDLTSSAGGFYSAEDADSLPSADAPEKREGAFYVWSENEIKEHLTPSEALVFARTYGVESGGNTSPESDPHGELRGQNVLIRINDPDVVAKLSGLPEDEVRQLLESARRKLLSVRSERPRPHLDDKIVTGWNGLMISALARAFQVLEDPRYLASAQNAARFLRANLYPKPLLRSFRE